MSVTTAIKHGPFMCVCKNRLISVIFEDHKAETIKPTAFWEGAGTYSRQEKWAVAYSPPGTQAKGGYKSDKLRDVTRGSTGKTLCMLF